jgi:O-antigen ligase
MSVMGGGPIVFSRWLVIGSLILFLHPNVNKIYKYLFVPLFILFSLMAGSRGPIYSYAIIMIIYFVFTFRKNILKVLVLSLLALSVVFLIPVENNKNEYGNTSRVVMGTSIGGYARIDRIERSVKLMTISPLGVGTGNWAMESNKFSLLSHRDKEYAHNIILELANESGILISIVFLILVVLLFMSAFEVIREKERYLSRIFFVLFFFMLLNALVSGDLMDDRFLFIFLSLYLSSVTLENNLEKQLTK